MQRLHPFRAQAGHGLKISIFGVEADELDMVLQGLPPRGVAAFLGILVCACVCFFSVSVCFSVSLSVCLSMYVCM